MIPIHLATEDQLSEAVLRRLLSHASRGYWVGNVYGRSGFGYLRKTIAGWNQSARSQPFLVLTDLDDADCPMSLIEKWLPLPRHPNLLFRIAVREVESWLLADSERLPEFLRVSSRRIPSEPDGLVDAKQTLIELARTSRSPEIRGRIVPRPGSTAKQGPDYNACLETFVANHWSIDRARSNSGSLERTVRRLAAFEPVWPEKVSTKA
jgi:hypothetical protein